MASTPHDAPELVPQNFPEVVQAPQFQQYQFAQPLPGTPIKSPGSSYAATGYASVPEAISYFPHPSGVVDARSAAHQELATEKGGRKRVVCGCSLIVFILSCIIGVLAAAVIGLAAGTGVEANRAATAEAQVEELKSSLTATATSASATATATAVANTWDNLTNNCSTKADSVTTSTYTTQFFGKVTFTMYCNRDTPHGPIMSLFVADFNTCMDACAAYTSYTNTTCAAVSFAPAWSNKTTAIAGTAPGDCYLKPGPQNRTALTDVNAGTEVHSAILLTD